MNKFLVKSSNSILHEILKQVNITSKELTQIIISRKVIDTAFLVVLLLLSR